MCSGADLTASDPSPEACERFARATGGQPVADNAEVVRRADVLFLAVKPQQIPAVAAELKGLLGGDSLVISIAAGVRLSALAQGLGEKVRLVRVMPNTPCLVGKGACGYCLGGNGHAGRRTTRRAIAFRGRAGRRGRRETCSTP